MIQTTNTMKQVMCYQWTGTLLSCLMLAIIVAAEKGEVSTRPESEDNLLQDFRKAKQTYNKYVAPTHFGPVEVALQMSLINFEFKDEANELTTMHVWLEQTWTDSRLQWDPLNYNGTDEIVLPVDNLWLPDIDLMSSGSTKHNKKPVAWVQHSGSVTYFVSISIETICRLDLRYFPYDEQTCTLFFGSWTYYSDVVKLAPCVCDLTHVYKQVGNDFDIIELDAKAHEFEEYGWEWSNAEYSIHLTRISTAYSVKLVLPAVVTGFLILMTFLLPPTSQEKITLAGLILISLVLQLVNLQDLVPASGNTMLGDFLAFATCVDFFAILLAVLSYYVYNKNTLQDGEAKDEESTFCSLPLPHCCEQTLRLLRFLDTICFVVFFVILTVGVTVILGQRG